MLTSLEMWCLTEGTQRLVTVWCPLWTSKFDLILSHLFQMFLHARENHNDRHHRPEKQEERESQPAYGGVVCWRAAWWQEAGGRATQTRCLQKRRVMISRAYIFLYYETQAQALGGWGIIRIMHASPAVYLGTNKTNNNASSVRTTIISFLLHTSRELETNGLQSSGLWLKQPSQQSSPFLCFLSTTVNRIIEKSCVIQTAKRWLKHWDCSWDQPSFTKTEFYTSLRCEHGCSDEEKVISMVQTGHTTLSTHIATKSANDYNLM